MDPTDKNLLTLKGPQKSSVEIGSTWYPTGEFVADISLNAAVCRLLVDKCFSVLECAPCTWANCFTPEALAFMTWVGKAAGEKNQLISERDTLSCPSFLASWQLRNWHFQYIHETTSCH